jgi:hypothetical protein
LIAAASFTLAPRDRRRGVLAISRIDVESGRGSAGAAAALFAAYGRSH